MKTFKLLMSILVVLTVLGLHGAMGQSTEVYVLSSGQVCIGTEIPALNYKLSVDGDIICEEVYVLDSGDWPDWVFDEGYELMSLQELENSIREYNHLPGLPPASEVEENGFELGDMQKRVLQKVEELTLYTIEQGKQLSEQAALIDELQKKVTLLETENQQLKKTKR
jgi:hypothetical protein